MAAYSADRIVASAMIVWLTLFKRSGVCLMLYKRHNCCQYPCLVAFMLYTNQFHQLQVQNVFPFYELDNKVIIIIIEHWAIW